MNLREVILEPIPASEEARFQRLMQTHHYLGALPKIGHTLWYVATWQDEWLALLSFSAPAWKCAARDGYSDGPQAPKWVFIRPLVENVQAQTAAQCPPGLPICA